MESENGKKKEALDLLSLARKEEEAQTVSDLPIPEDIPEDIKAALVSPIVDNNIYSYKELVEKYRALPKLPKYSTGFKEIDELLDGGIQEGEVMVLSGPTKSGKTLWAQNMSFHQAEKHIPSLWFSLELSWQEFISRMMDLDFYNLHIDQVEDLPIFAPVNNRNFSLKKVREQIIEAKKTRDIKMVYIDHLHFLLPFSAAERNSSFVLGAVMRELKQMAVELEVAVLLIAHTKKIEIGVAPDINSIRDSSFISQESDFTVIIWRERLKVDKKNLDDNLDEDVYTKRTYVSLEAARRGRTRRMLFGVIDGHFYNWETFQRMEQMPSTEKEFKRDLKRREEYAQKEAEKAAAPQKAPEQTQMVVISELNREEQKKKAQDLLELADNPQEEEEVDEYGMTAQERRDNLDSLFTW